MFDAIVTIVLAAIPVILLYRTLQDWRKSKNNWFLLPLILFLLSIFSVIADWWNGLLVTVFGLIVYVIVGRTTKK
jgi:ABC-type polysaccharide/polyol phosphate export permease